MIEESQGENAWFDSRLAFGMGVSIGAAVFSWVARVFDFNVAAGVMLFGLIIYFILFAYHKI